MLSVKSSNPPVCFETASLRSNWNTFDDVIAALNEKQIGMTEVDQITLDKQWNQLFKEQRIFSTGAALLLCFEGLALAEASGRIPIGIYLVVLEKFLRKFEINKKLYVNYQAPSFAPGSKQTLSYNDYGLFSAALFLAYRQTSDLRLLSAILKNDFTSSYIRSSVHEIIEAL